MSLYKSVDEIIGKTPMMELCKIKNELNLKANIFAKLEFFNPAGSVKDRVAKKLIEEAEKDGKLTKGSVIIEPTSGNTGIGLASVGASKGYRVIIVMPDTMSVERRLLMKAYGAELVLSEGKLGMKGAIKKAEELAKSIPNSFIPEQFSNPNNPKAHFDTTGPEIYNDMNGNIDIFVAGVGTGGTITGIGEYLKSKNENIEIIAVEPEESPFLSKSVAGAHMLQGIGAGFIPDILNTSIYDKIFTVTTNQAFDMSRLLGKKEGILVGISSGAALFAAKTLAEKEENKDKNIVVLLPDTGERYLSSDLFSE